MPRQSESTIKLISQRDLRTLADQCRNYKRKADSANGNMRELIGEAVQKKNLHKGVFSLMMRLGRMDGEELNTWKMNFDDQWEKLGYEKIAKQQGRLRLDDVVAEDEKVTRMRPRRVSETAGEAAE